jgi:hypothetical protein
MIAAIGDSFTHKVRGDVNRVKLSHVDEKVQVHPSMAILRSALVLRVLRGESEVANISYIVSRNLGTIRVEVQWASRALFVGFGVGRLVSKVVLCDILGFLVIECIVTLGSGSPLRSNVERVLCFLIHNGRLAETFHIDLVALGLTCLTVGTSGHLRDILLLKCLVVRASKSIGASKNLFQTAHNQLLLRTLRHGLWAVVGLETLGDVVEERVDILLARFGRLYDMTMLAIATRRH